MSVTISDESARAILAQSFLNALPKDKQESLIREAIERLMTDKDKNSYSNPHGLTFLERVFHEEVTKQIRELIAELLKKEPLQSQLKDAAALLLNRGMKQFQSVYEAAVKAMLEKALGVRA